MANNRNPPSDPASEPGVPESDERNSGRQQQQVPPSATPESDESTTTNPWIKNKAS